METERGQDFVESHENGGPATPTLRSIVTNFLCRSEKSSYIRNHKWRRRHEPITFPAYDPDQRGLCVRGFHALYLIGVGRRCAFVKTGGLSGKIGTGCHSFAFLESYRQRIGFSGDAGEIIRRAASP